ncbi:MAG: hypothetical protein RLP15_10550 [Cryomorphaceae bacterium]
MKTFLKLSFLSAALLMVASSCQKVTQTTRYTANTPQYLSYEDLRSSIHNENEQKLERPGKIFLYNSMILINEFEKGIHIYDNSNPSAPSHIGFINIPGNVDIALRDNVLYVDSYVDLVAIDISDPSNAREIGRANDALSYTIPSQMDWTYPVARIDRTKGVVTGFEVAEVEETCENQECRTYYRNNMSRDWDGAWGGQMMSETGSPVSFSGNANNVRSSSSSTGGNGIAGSMARFMLVENFLYVISDENTVKIFDIATTNMREVNSFKPWQSSGDGWGVIETLFTFKDRLFIGSAVGMLAFDVSDPASPQYLSSYNHLTSCDPVVANDDYAFVTLRAGAECTANNTNQMDVLDISDIMSPRILQTVVLANPHGLDIDSDKSMVFVCDGTDGLKVFDFTDVAQISNNRLNHISGINTYDIILNNGIAHVIGDGGLRQYNYDDAGNLNELSTIPLN